ncbi:MAG: dephospho-CoA kinase, partial [Firmicutes bacterium]|nr:dephospho-CoA kinase [Bacillota bacterium]
EMTVIGLTGTMGSGKSTVSSILKHNGYTVYDSDEMSRALTAKGGPALPLIAERFGADMIDGEGRLDRKKLAAVVFSDPKEREALEEIVTARVVADIRETIGKIREGKLHEGEKAVFFDVPLLFESGLSEDMDECWCVTADDETRISRIMLRDGLSREEILARFANQMPQEEKIEKSDLVIDNSGSIIDLEYLLTNCLNVII